MTETYITCIEQRYLRDILCKFRLGVSDILCHKNRYNERDRTCPVCKAHEETEMHFLITCSAYNTWRVRFLPQVVVDHGDKVAVFSRLMSSDCPETVLNICRFLNHAFRQRLDLLK